MNNKDAPVYNNVLATKLRAELDHALAREAVLQGVVDNLCEQQERQLDMEDCAGRCSFPAEFPKWSQAWEQAFAVRYGASEVAQELLKKVDKCVRSLETILDLTKLPPTLTGVLSLLNVNRHYQCEHEEEK